MPEAFESENFPSPAMVHFTEMNPQFKRSNFHHTVTRSRETVAGVRTAPWRLPASWMSRSRSLVHEVRCRKWSNVCFFVS